MNSWLTRFRINAARDEGRPLPESLRQKINRSAELREFKESDDALERALRSARPDPAAPPFLAGSIMRAVRQCGKPAERTPSCIAMWRNWSLAVVGVLAVVLSGFWWMGRRPVVPPAPAAGNLALPASALELGDTVTRTLPLATVAPLNDELDRVNLDLTNTARFLLANVP